MTAFGNGVEALAGGVGLEGCAAVGVRADRFPPGCRICDLGLVAVVSTRGAGRLTGILPVTSSPESTAGRTRVKTARSAGTEATLRERDTELKRDVAFGADLATETEEE